MISPVVSGTMAKCTNPDLYHVGHLVQYRKRTLALTVLCCACHFMSYIQSLIQIFDIISVMKTDDFFKLKTKQNKFSFNGSILSPKRISTREFSVENFTGAQILFIKYNISDSNIPLFCSTFPFVIIKYISYSQRLSCDKRRIVCILSLDSQIVLKLSAYDDFYQLFLKKRKVKLIFETLQENETWGTNYHTTGQDIFIKRKLIVLYFQNLKLLLT